MGTWKPLLVARADKKPRIIHVRADDYTCSRVASHDVWCVLFSVVVGYRLFFYPRMSCNETRTLAHIRYMTPSCSDHVLRHVPDAHRATGDGR